MSIFHFTFEASNGELHSDNSYVNIRTAKQLNREIQKTLPCFVSRQTACILLAISLMLDQDEEIK